MKCGITENIPKINDKGGDLHIFHQSPSLREKKNGFTGVSVPVSGSLTLMGSVLS